MGWHRSRNGDLGGGQGLEDRVVARRNLPDGTDLLVIQQYSSDDLGCEVGFYFRKSVWDWIPSNW